MKEWMLFVHFLILYLKLTVVFAKDVNGNVNIEFDKSLSFIQDVIKGEEPLTTPPMRDFIDYCNITGFATMYRSGDITAIKVNESISRLYINLGWKRLIVSCLIHNKVLSVKVATAIVSCQIENLRIYTNALVNYDDDHHTRILTAQIVNPGKFEMQYNGQGFLGKTIQFFVGLLKPTVSKMVHSLVVETVEILIHKNKHRLGFLGGGEN